MWNHLSHVVMSIVIDNKRHDISEQYFFVKFYNVISPFWIYDIGKISVKICIISCVRLFDVRADVTFDSIWKGPL